MYTSVTVLGVELMVEFEARPDEPVQIEGVYLDWQDVTDLLNEWTMQKITQKVELDVEEMRYEPA